MIAQRNALLAWTGHTLALTPRTNTKISLAHWGNTHVTGRGLLALSGRGQIHQFHLKTGEEYVVHPSNVIAYSQMQHAPQPYRFKATSFRLQVPALNGLLPDTRFWRLTRESAAWKYVSQTAWTVRTWARRTIWGDRVWIPSSRSLTSLILDTALPSLPRSSDHSHSVSRRSLAGCFDNKRCQRDRRRSGRSSSCGHTQQAGGQCQAGRRYNLGYLKTDDDQLCNGGVKWDGEVR